MRNLILGLLFVILGVTQAWSEEQGTEREYSVSIEGSGIAKADVDGGKGQMGVAKTRFKARLGDFSLSYALRSYFWSDKGKLPFGNSQDNPWDRLHRISLGYKYEKELGEAWLITAGGDMHLGFEKDLAGALGAIVYGSASCMLSEKWMITIGAASLINKVHTQFYPIFGLSWNHFAPRGWSAALGFPLTRIGYRFNSKWFVYTGALFEIHTFHLDKDSRVEESGFVETRDIIGGLFTEYTPYEDLKLTAGLSWDFARKMTIYDWEGNEKDSYKVDNAPSALLRLQYFF